MGLSKSDTAVAVVAGLILLGAKKAFASESPSGKKASSDDGTKLVARANQPAAMAWIPAFMQVHAMSKGTPIHITEPLAQAYARWAGIESSGNPLIPSRLDERGLMQVGPALGGPATTPPPPAFEQSDWVALTDPETSHEQHVDMAIHYVDWLYGRAAHYISDPPTDGIDQIWYAKLYHQRPVDLRDGKMHGPAIAMAKELASRWANDAKSMHRLRAANVVAFGTPTP